MFFEKLPKPWQEAIIDSIYSHDDGEHPEIAAAYREELAGVLLEFELTPKPSKKDYQIFSSNYGYFCDGWIAAVGKLAPGSGTLIAAWVRAKGEPTDFSDLENNDYPAFIVKESDVLKLETSV